MLPTEISTTSSGQTQMHNANMGVANYSSGKAAIFEGFVKHAVAQKVYLYVPFLFTDEDNDWDETFAKVTFFCLEMTENTDLIKEKFWSKYKKVAKQTLNRRRASITTGLKKIFFGMYQC